ncbi:hypothetical protein V1389_17750 [Flavobacterium rakeshii]|uniref:hypothetical protein n=1 Tax=Flavobacterium rakeshii TaxID=1038845 RepID=UPI002E7BEDAC|nr:hypothetical protein [Flavobacterium rakeshii]MEE1900194.1 hypothetical protein [Flavobacterium rakeshii]
MKITKLLTAIIILSLFSCGQNKAENDAIASYTIGYAIPGANSSVMVYDNNDTIYFSNVRNPEIFQYKKITSNSATVNQIKTAITKHLNYDCLESETKTISSPCFFQVYFNNENTQIVCYQEGICSKEGLPKNVQHLFTMLEGKYPELRLTE